MRKRIAFLIGDVTGVGPEISANCLHQYKNIEDVDVLLVGDYKGFLRALEITGVDLPHHLLSNPADVSSKEGYAFFDVPLSGGGELPFGEVSAEAGDQIRRSLEIIVSLIDEKVVQGFVFAPFNKEALKLGGFAYSSELEMFKDHFNQPQVPGEINFADPIWTNRVTSHIAVKDIASWIRKDRVLETIRFLDKEMRRFGKENPRIAVSALNPHCGEKGLFGREEIDEIDPAVLAARDEGIDAYGSFPADTIFLRVQKGEFDAVVSMYHDQGQVATKLLGFDRGVTIHGSMPVPIATCAHGTAFDIAGSGKASPNALMAALKLVTESLGV